MRAQLYSMQGLPNGQISIMACPRGGDWLIDEVRALDEAGVDVVVALMAASLLVMNGFTPEQAFTQLSKARGYQVPETEEQKVWVQTLYRDSPTTA